MITWLRQNFYIFLALNAIGLFLSNDMFLPAINTIAHTFHTQQAYVSLGIGAFIFGSLLFQLFAGAIADTLGYKKSLLYSNIFFMFATISIAFAPSLFWFLFFRALQGIGTCMFPTAGFASINEFYHDKKAVLALAITTSIVYFSPIAGPIIGALILKVSNWHGIFIADLFALMFASVLLYFFMPDVQRRATIQKTAAANTNFLQVLLNMRLLLKNKPFIQQCAALGFFTAILSVWITASPHMLMGNLGLSPESYSFLQTPVLIAFVIANAFSPFLIRKKSPRKVLQTIMSFLLFYALALIIIYTFFHSFNIITIICTLCSLFFIRGLTNSIQMQNTLSLERTYQASSAALLQFINRIFSLTGSLFISAFYGFSNQFYIIVLACLALSGAIMTLQGFRSNKLNVSPEEVNESKI